MTIRILSSLVLLAFAFAPIAGQEKKSLSIMHASNSSISLPAYGSAMKTARRARKSHVKYKVTAGGSAVVETIMPGTDHEMVTVIHPDGADLLLTHYCMLGNQPQMKATGKGDGNKVAFKFVRATNLKSEKDMHMHDVTFTFVDKDTLRTDWTHYIDGKAAGPVVFELKRQK